MYIPLGSWHNFGGVLLYHGNYSGNKSNDVYIFWRRNIQKNTRKNYKYIFNVSEPTPLLCLKWHYSFLSFSHNCTYLIYMLPKKIGDDADTE